MLGIFADASINSAGTNGLLLGGTSFFFKELIAVLGTSIYAFGISYAMLWLINKVTPVKVSNTDEENGLDEALHGEVAYEMI
jgi:Amt family ammonium transporter